MVPTLRIWVGNYCEYIQATWWAPRLRHSWVRRSSLCVLPAGPSDQCVGRRPESRFQEFDYTTIKIYIPKTDSVEQIRIQTGGGLRTEDNQSQLARIKEA